MSTVHTRSFYSFQECGEVLSKHQHLFKDTEDSGKSAASLPDCEVQLLSLQVKHKSLKNIYIVIKSKLKI